jgi:Carboxypeptidase regulatory-like domain/TonB-dependent Receptor Plug Domain
MISKYLIIISILIGSSAFAQTGIISGKVIDGKTGLPLGGDSIVLIENSISVVSDQNGVFIFNKLQAGNYSVKCKHKGYSEKIVTDIVVADNENKEINISLNTTSKKLEGIGVKATRVKAAGETVATLLVAQKNSASVSDGVSAESIKKTPDRSSSDVIKRVTGASIQNDKFAIIRGLNDRYNASFINGAPLPSTESDRKAFAYDIFPSGIIDNLIIYKTATPDKTAEFGGGIIEVSTKSTTSKPITIISIGQGFNSLITGKNRFVSEMKGGTDWLGLDDGSRTLPSGIPADKQGFIDASTANKIGYAKLFGKYKWGIKEVNTDPNLSLQIIKSLNIKRKEKEFISSLFSVTYNKSNSFVSGERNSFNGGSNINDPNYAPIQEKKVIDSVYNEEVIWSALGNIGIKLNNRNNISWKNNISINTDNTLVKREGYSEYTIDSTNKIKEIFRNFVSDRIFNSQLLGDHQIGKFKTKLNWLVAYSKVDRSTPFQAISTNNQLTSDAPGRHGNMVSANSQENIKSGKLDVSQPYQLFEGSQNIFRLGFGYIARERNYTNRVLGFAKATTNNPYEVDNSILNLPYDQAFLTQNIGLLSNGKATTFVNDATVPNSAYDAASSTMHAYLMNDQRYKKFRLIYGVRIESFNQKLVAAQRGLGAINVNYTKLDYCPSANLVYSLTEKTNIRLSASKTLNRPEYRELANFGFEDFLSGFFVGGDSTLQRASINNYDVRYEIFPGRAQLLSVSAFHKAITNPIEFSTSSFAPSEARYVQSKSATISGAELEFRTLLSTILFIKNEKSLLNNFTLSGNGTITKSSVAVGSTVLDSFSSRPLQGQSPYIINVALSYASDSSGLSSTLSLNRIGRRLAIAGSNLLPEFYDKERTVVDFQIAKTFLKDKVELKFNARDILAQDIVTYLDFDRSRTFTQKDRIFTNSRAPRVFIFSASIKL